MVQDHRLYERLTAATEGAGIESSAFLGVFVKSVSTSGLVTFQQADGTEETAQLPVGSVPSWVASATSYDAATNLLSLTIDALAGAEPTAASVVYFLAPTVLPRDADSIRVTVNGHAGRPLRDLNVQPVAARDITPGMLIQTLYNFNNHYVIVEPLGQRPQDFDIVVTWHDGPRSPAPVTGDLTAAEASAGDSFSTSLVTLPSYPGTETFAWPYFGVPDDAPDISLIEYENSFTTQSFEATGDTLPVGGVPHKWYRFQTRFSGSAARNEYRILFAPYS